MLFGFRKRIYGKNQVKKRVCIYVKSRIYLRLNTIKKALKDL
jgi:hypothetical protein